MCSDCGCSDGKDAIEVKSGGHTIPVMTSLLDDNDRQAAHNREHFEANGTLCINLMSSPGSGKTSLLEATIEVLANQFRIAVIEGDLATENDAARIRSKNIPAVQITTGQACHLDAGMVHAGLHELDLARTDILFIENVGNLVCPAGFDLGQHANVVLLSVTEGDDKPAKYPVMFRAADLVLLSKSDLLDFIDDFDPAKAEGYVRNISGQLPVMQISARRADTLQPWIEWLAGSVERLRGRADAAE